MLLCLDVLAVFLLKEVLPLFSACSSILLHGFFDYVNTLTTHTRLIKGWTVQKNLIVWGCSELPPP